MRACAFAQLKDYLDRYHWNWVNVKVSSLGGPRAGDLMRSIQLLQFVAEDAALEVRARDHRVNWMTAVAALDADTYLGAENSYNLFALRKNSDAAADEDRSRLEARPARHASVCGLGGVHIAWCMFFWGLP